MLCALLATSSVEAQTDVCVEILQRSWFDLAREESRSGSPDTADGARVPNAEAPNTEAPNGAAAPPQIEPNVLGPVAPDGEADFDAEDLLDAAPEPAPVYIPVQPARATNAPATPLEGTSQLAARAYLRRLFEHYVTHEDGFQAVPRGCAERLTVELYPLDSGWTVFARYSGHAREEKIDHVEFEELDALAQRVTRALLTDVSVQETLTRTTVLGADSESELRRIRGGKQFLFGLGAVMLFGTHIPTSVSTSGGEVLDERFRLIVPLQAIIGMRSFYRAWALDSYVGLRLGTSRRSSSTAANHHVDYTAGFTAGMHFLRYMKPEAVSSFYAGGGASFVVERYRATSTGGAGLWGGGMQLDLVVGHEFMRASSLHFFVELTASVPAYRFDTERAGARIDSYIPSAILQIGLLH